MKLSKSLWNEFKLEQNKNNIKNHWWSKRWCLVENPPFINTSFLIICIFVSLSWICMTSINSPLENWELILTLFEFSSIAQHCNSGQWHPGWRRSVVRSIYEHIKYTLYYNGTGIPRRTRIIEIIKIIFRSIWRKNCNQNCRKLHWEISLGGFFNFMAETKWRVATAIQPDNKTASAFTTR